MTQVREVMTTTVVTAGEAMPYRHLVGLLYARGIGAVPVVDPECQVLGVVSGADLAAKAACPLTAPARPRLESPRRRQERRKARARTAGELMTAPAVTVTPEATIGQAARIMRGHRVGRLPVTDPDNGRLAGIVTRSDLLRVYLRPGEEIRAEIEAEVLRRVPGADPSWLTVAVHDGVVTISGQVEQKSAVSSLRAIALQIEGVIQVDENITYVLDDRYPSAPFS
jgi:CBS domain-containing protein